MITLQHIISLSMYNIIYLSYIAQMVTKGVIRSRKLKDRHYNGQKHEQWFTKYLQASVIAQYISSNSHENVHIPSFNE